MLAAAAQLHTQFFWLRQCHQADVGQKQYRKLRNRHECGIEHGYLGMGKKWDDFNKSEWWSDTKHGLESILDLFFSFPEPKGD